VKSITSLLIVSAIFVSGCHHFTEFDRTPPSAPSGLRTESGDNFVDLYWSPNREADIAGYNVFVSSSYDGRYELIASTRSTYFRDNGAVNGYDQYYAVTAYDYDGNESELSRDVAYDVPRPEGYDVLLRDYHVNADVSGYDFSTFSIVPFDGQYTDMYFEDYQGDLYMNVRTDTDIQDLGPTSSLLDFNTAPSSGWSPTHDVRIYPGHTYVVWTWDDHYAKFRVVFDWAYQLQTSNPMFKRIVPATRAPMTGQPPVR
jgi:hypothetical protein